MRTNFLLVVGGLVAACDERPVDERVREQRLPFEDTEDVSVDPAPTPDPSVDDRNAPVDPNTPTRDRDLDLEHERATLSRMIDARIERVDARIAALEARGGSAAKDTVALLRAKRDQARAKLSELDDTSYEDWVAYKRDVYAAWEALERDVDAATR